MERLRVGIIGLGMIGIVHLHALRRIPGVTVTAIAHTKREKLDELQGSYGIEHTFTDWRDLVFSDHVDVVHNCTPNHLHLEINEACLKAGKAVFSEKPLGLNADETKTMAALAQEVDVPAGVNFNYRYFPAVQWAKHLIDTGELGEIRAVHGHYLQDWLMYEDDFNWRVDSAKGGPARALGDIGTHWLDLAQYLIGRRVERVFADLGTMIPRRKDPETGVWVDVDTEDWASALLQFTDGVKGSFTVSQISGGHKNDLEIEIVGSKASLRWRQEEPEMIWIGRRGGINEMRYKEPAVFEPELQDFTSVPAGHVEGYGDCVLNSISNFYNNIRTSQTDYPTFAWGHWITKLTAALIESSLREAWITCEPDFE